MNVETRFDTGNYLIQQVMSFGMVLRDCERCMWDVSHHKCFFGCLSALSAINARFSCENDPLVRYLADIDLSKTVC